MISYKDNDTKRKIIMEHYSNPQNKVENTKQFENYSHIYLHSQNCVDEINIALKIESNTQIIKDAKFSGLGCAVFLASSDIFLSRIINKKISDVQIMIDEYEKLLHQQNADETLLEKLVVFHNVKTHLNRLECALMISNALKKIF